MKLNEITNEDLAKLYLDDPDAVVMSSVCELIAGDIVVTIEFLLETGLKSRFTLTGDTSFSLFQQAQKRMTQ